MSIISVRKYQPGEEQQLRHIFSDTIHHVNKQHYNQEQIDAWAPEQYDIQEWEQRIHNINPYVALDQRQIVGYADIQDDGFIDHFFCHYQHQRKGVGNALFKTIGDYAKKQSINTLYSNVSITARPFFESKGFIAHTPKEVVIRGIKLTNFSMRCELN